MTATAPLHDTTASARKSRRKSGAAAEPHPGFVADFERARDAKAAGESSVRIDHLPEAEQRKLLFGE